MRWFWKRFGGRRSFCVRWRGRRVLRLRICRLGYSNWMRRIVSFGFVCFV